MRLLGVSSQLVALTDRLSTVLIQADHIAPFLALDCAVPGEGNRVVPGSDNEMASHADRRWSAHATGRYSPTDAESD